MKFFLSARYSRREELLGYSTILKNTGHEVSARWLTGEHEAKDETATNEEMRDWALDDMNDINQADTFLLFTDELARRGGHYVEYGYALGIGKEAYLIGQPTNVFSALVPRFDTFNAFLDYLLRNPELFECDQTTMELN
jgi:hypothetical protein